MEIDAASGEVQAPAVAAPKLTLLNWLHEGARTLVGRLPRWERVHASPPVLLLLVLLDILITVSLSRLYIDGEASFNWRASLSGWAGFTLVAWACYVLRPAPAQLAEGRPAPSASALLAMITAQGIALTLPTSILYVLLYRSGVLGGAGEWLPVALWVSYVAWLFVAMLVLMLRTGGRRWSQRIAAVCAVTLAFALSYHFSPAPSFWVARESGGGDADYTPIKFSQATFENQAPLLAARLQALAPQRPGIADMYTLTFAPYEGEEVFRRESRMVADVMAKRFDAAGRGVQLLNHREHVDNMPWATALNLQRAIAGIANTMDRDEDVLFIHLTSHGAQDGELAANFWPLDIDTVMPPELKQWLDDAGIRNRVISISACYSGSWIAPLANDDTLVMTASDAEHTSYGCGRKSALTFFGRAMYDEQLRSKTRSFEQAHAVARTVIEKREKEAGKNDGYSNPQIKMGSRIAPLLEKMRVRLGG